MVLMARACFDPRAAVQVWRRMEKLTGSEQPPAILSTHPSNAKVCLHPARPTFYPFLKRQGGFILSGRSSNARMVLIWYILPFSGANSTVVNGCHGN